MVGLPTPPPPARSCMVPIRATLIPWLFVQGCSFMHTCEARFAMDYHGEKKELIEITRPALTRAGPLDRRE